LQVARSCWAPLEKDSYWAQMMRTFDGCLTTTLAYTWNIFISDLIFYPILHAFPELQSSLEYCLLEIGRAIVFFVPAALLYARSHSKVKPTDASEPATFRHRLHVHLVEAAISLAGAALAAAMYDFCTIWLAEKTSTGGGIGLAFAMYAFLCVIALAAARRFGWGPSFFRREIDTTTAYAFWYPFSDSLEYIPGYDVDGIEGALITTGTAIVATVVLGLIASKLDSAIQPPPPPPPEGSPSVPKPRTGHTPTTSHASNPHASNPAIGDGLEYGGAHIAHLGDGLAMMHMNGRL